VRTYAIALSPVSTGNPLRDVPTESLSVHTYVTAPDSSVTNFAVLANQPRPDVNRLLGISGDHGYTSTKAISQRGLYKVCTYGIAASPLQRGTRCWGARLWRTNSSSGRTKNHQC
jgi:hypothetical protein